MCCIFLYWIAVIKSLIFLSVWGACSKRNIVILPSGYVRKKLKNPPRWRVFLIHFIDAKTGM